MIVKDRIVEGGHLQPFNLMKPKPDVCQECACDHDPALPHDKDSLYYQYYFYNKHGRWPTWADAMAHCSDGVKKAWTEAMKELGVDIK